MQEKREPAAEAGKRRSEIRNFVLALWGGEDAANARLVALIAGMAFGLAAYFLGGCEMLFSTYPLGVALLAAADRHLPFILIGMILSALTGGSAIAPAVAVATYCVMAAVRVFIKLAIEGSRIAPKKTERISSVLTAQGKAEKVRDFYGSLFGENVYMRMATACFGAFCLSLYAIISGGFRYYDLFGAFFSMVAAPVAAFVFAAYFDKTLVGHKLHDVGALALLAAVTYSVKTITFFGVYVGAFVAFFATLCVGRRRGILQGCLTGLCLGLAFEPIYAPLFILEAAAAGVLWNVSSLAAATAGCIVGTIWGVYVGGISSLSRLLPALLCGAMVFGAADKLSLITSNPELIRVKADGRTELEALLRAEINKRDESCMNKLSTMFSELAEAFYNLSDRQRRPAALDLRQTCDSVFDSHCSECPKRELCWGIEYGSTLEVLGKFSSDLHMKARTDISSAPEYLRERCEKMPEILSEINENCARLTEHALLCDRTGVFALDYDGMAKILAETLEQGREDYIIDDGTAGLVADELKRLRFSFVGVIAYGGRRKSVAVKKLDASRAKIGIGDLRDALSEATGIAFGDPVFTPVGEGFDMMISARRAYTVKAASKQICAVGHDGKSNVCGDTYTSFDNDGDRYYSLISDGMGAGKEAALTSRIVCMFLDKMLTAGNRPETSIRLCNSFMSERDGGARHECSATVDLLEFDLITGGMSVIKSGAAPTYIKRGNNCFKLQSKTLPLGIIDTPDLNRIKFDVESGDKIVMFSDGVTQNREDCKWLTAMLNEDWNDTPDVMASKIAERARAEGSEDDITVTVVEVETAEIH